MPRGSRHLSDCTLPQTMKEQEVKKISSSLPEELNPEASALVGLPQQTLPALMKVKFSSISYSCNVNVSIWAEDLYALYCPSIVCDHRKSSEAKTGTVKNHHRHYCLCPVSYSVLLPTEEGNCPSQITNFPLQVDVRCRNLFLDKVNLPSNIQSACTQVHHSRFLLQKYLSPAPLYQCIILLTQRQTSKIGQINCTLQRLSTDHGLRTVDWLEIFCVVYGMHS